MWSNLDFSGFSTFFDLTSELRTRILGTIDMIVLQYIDRD